MQNESTINIKKGNTINLLELNEINLIEERTKCHGVYFMYHNGEIVYIGSSIDIEGAVQKKHRQGIEYDTYRYLPLESREEAINTAVQYIFKYQPICNTVLPHNKLVISNHQFKKLHGIGRADLSRLVKKGLIKMYTLGSDIYFKTSDVDQLMREYHG